MKTKVIVITGPTAVGKSLATVKLAKLMNTEVISADSMQIYKYMDIGTAKISTEEMQGIKHHLIDKFTPDIPYSVAIFKNLAKKLIDDISSAGKIPIICGGTGFYINALLHDVSFEDDAIPSISNTVAYRDELLQLTKTHDVNFIHNMLKAIDPQSAKTIPSNNIKRVIRALEFYKQHNMPISTHNSNQKAKKMAYDAKVFILNQNRDNLYKKINKRVDDMIAKGLLQEVNMLLSMGYSPSSISMQALGYKQILAYLDGKCSLQHAIEAIKQGSRRFAKRQITWFKHQLNTTENQNEQVIWLNTEDYTDINSLACHIYNNYNKLHPET